MKTFYFGVTFTNNLWSFTWRLCVNREDKYLYNSYDFSLLSNNGLWFSIVIFMVNCYLDVAIPFVYIIRNTFGSKTPCSTGSSLYTHTITTQHLRITSQLVATGNFVHASSISVINRQPALGSWRQYPSCQAIINSRLPTITLLTLSHSFYW